MNNIPDALKSAVAQWEQEDRKVSLFKPTNNVSRETFNFIKGRPNGTTQTLTIELAKRGFKATSTSTLVAQMVKQGMVEKDAAGRLKALVPEYTPLRKSLQRGALPPAKRKYTKHAPSAGIAALHPQAKSVQASSLLDTLSVVQARALYDALKKIFGDAR
jgi:hypothetical protein